MRAATAFLNKLNNWIRLARPNAQSYQALETYRRNKASYRAVADPEKVIWVPVDKLSLKVGAPGTINHNDILSGDWDLKRRSVADTPKYRSVLLHFRDGVSWEHTPIFEIYVKRLKRGGKVRGCTTIADLKRQMDESLEPLYEDIRKNGIRVPRRRRRRIRDLPNVHIGRDGEILLGNNGNHRIAMAHLLKIEQIPCVVYGRHIHWQALRERANDCAADEIETTLAAALLNHPDLADILTEKLGSTYRRPHTIISNRWSKIR
jgi:hypothetical protein